MAMMVLDCARCPVKRMTHDVVAGIENSGQFELFLRCRACFGSALWAVTSTWPLSQLLTFKGTLMDNYVFIQHLIRPKGAVIPAPEHTPEDLKLMFDEATECVAIGAWNASSAMFRKILDQISKERMASAPTPPPDNRTRYNLKPRLAWLFSNGLLPRELEQLADAIREDANDGVHNAPLGQTEALDIQDFTVEVLETLYTMPGRLRDAEARRAVRRGQTAP
ncbi:DUF4145 domain-containing protein [Bradyrhizobium oligotrophicum]|uniref:DUF4145 domain-containing protein n=1 Tax=Bradyrhizobium TaxID=374 RepID=UPI003EC1156B